MADFPVGARVRIGQCDGHVVRIHEQVVVALDGTSVTGYFHPNFVTLVDPSFSDAPNQTAEPPIWYGPDLVAEAGLKHVDEATRTKVFVAFDAAVPVADSELRDRIKLAIAKSYGYESWDSVTAVDDGEARGITDAADAAMTEVNPALADAYSKGHEDCYRDHDVAEKNAELEELRADKQAWQGHECEAGCTRPHLPPDGSPFGTDADMREEILRVITVATSGSRLAWSKVADAVMTRVAPVLAERAEQHAIILDVARLLGTSVRPNGLDRDVIVKALRGLKQQDERLHNDIAVACQALAAIADRKVWEYPPSLKHRIELVADKLDEARENVKRLRAELDRAHLYVGNQLIESWRGQPETEATEQACPHGDTNCSVVLGKPYHGNCHPWHYHLRAQLNGIHGALVGQGNELAGELRTAIAFLDVNAEETCGAVGYWGARNTRYECDKPKGHTEKLHENSSEEPPVIWFGDHAEQADTLQCDALGEGVCCRNEGHDGECDPGDDSPATPTEPRVWLRGESPPPLDVKKVRHDNSQVFTRVGPNGWRAGIGKVITGEQLIARLGGYKLTEVIDDLVSGVDSQPDSELCKREGLTPTDAGTLLIDCETHGHVATIAAGSREYERAEEAFAEHVAEQARVVVDQPGGDQT